MRKKLFSKLSVLLMVILIGVFALMACTTVDEGDGDIGNGGNGSQTPTKSQHLSAMGKVIANTFQLNPQYGFMMDIGANLSYNFDREDKKQYNWGYAFNIKGNFFVDGQVKQGFAIELVDTHKTYTEDEVALGKNIIFGVYNDVEENLYLQVGENTKLSFTNAPASEALKNILSASGVNLDFEVENMPVYGEFTTADLLEFILPLMAVAMDDVQKTDNDFTLTFRYTQMYAFVKEIVKTASPDTDLDEMLGSVAQYLPKEVTIKAVVRTDGTVFKGIDIVDTKVETKDNDPDGVFNLIAKATLFGEPASAWDVSTDINDALKAVEQTKVLNLKTSGKIELTKTVDEQGVPLETPTVTGEYNWKVRANIDLLKMMQKNFMITGAVGQQYFADNYLQIQLAKGNDPVLDIVYDPATMDSYDFNIIVKLDWLLKDVLGVDIGAISALVPSYYILPASPEALAFLISGASGEIGGTTSDGGDAGGGTVDPSGFDLNTIIELVKNVIGEVSIGGNAATLKVTNILNILGLQGVARDYINKVLYNADTAMFYDNAIEFANPANAAYSVYDDLQTKVDGSSKPSFGTWTNLTASRSNLLGKEYETNEGFLKVYEGKGSNEVRVDAKTRPVTVEELNSLIGVGTIRYKGSTMKGSYVSSYGSGFDLKICGYSGVDTALIGVQQEITVYLSLMDASGILNTVKSLGGDIAVTVTQLMEMPLIATQVSIILGQIESVDSKITVNNGQVLDLDKTYHWGDEFSSFGLNTTINYKANGAFPDGYSHTVNKLYPGYIDFTKIDTGFITSGGKQTIAARQDFVVEYYTDSQKFVSMVKVEAPTSITAAKSEAVPALIPVNYTIESKDALANWIRLHVQYADTLLTDVAITGSDIVIKNLQEMTNKDVWDSGSVTLLKTGTLIVGITFQGEDLGELTFTVEDKIPVYDVKFNSFEYTDTTLSGVIGIPSIADGTNATSGEGIAIAMKVYDENGAEVSGLTVTFEGINIDVATGNMLNLPLTITDELQIRYSITGLPSAETNYKVMVQLTHVGQNKDVGKTGTVYSKTALVWLAKMDSLKKGDYVDGLAQFQIANVASGQNLKRNVTNVTQFWLGDYNCSLWMENAEGASISFLEVMIWNIGKFKSVTGTLYVSSTIDGVEYKIGRHVST